MELSTDEIFTIAMRRLNRARDSAEREDWSEANECMAALHSILTKIEEGIQCEIERARKEKDAA